MHYLTKDHWFPQPDEATQDGLLAVGGSLSVRQLLLAYNSGIFPWFEEGQPILWWSPDPRMVLFPERFKVSKSLGKTIKHKKFEISFNQNFGKVINFCANLPRKGQSGTWITREMQEVYLEIHRAGYAVSVEVWKDGKIAGGLYGIDLPNKRVFCGESMFSLVSDASKVAFYHLAQYAISKNYKFIDCQIYNPHLESLGAEEISREIFLSILGE